MRKLAPLTLAVVALALPASAAASHPRYRLDHPRREHCRAHYVRKVEHVKRHGRKVRETFCVYVPPKAPAVVPPAPAVTPPAVVHPVLRAHLDPSFTQNPNNPLEATFLYSASANTQGVSESGPSLPQGVLELISDGKVACSTNVGGSNGEGGSCTVTFTSFGDHTVEVIYFSGESSATSGPETEDIAAPHVTLTLSEGVVVSGEGEYGSPVEDFEVEAIGDVENGVIRVNHGNEEPVIDGTGGSLLLANLSGEQNGQRSKSELELHQDDIRVTYEINASVRGGEVVHGPVIAEETFVRPEP
jgi:hypothetical protein